jgi:hypothetical protein
LELAAFSHHKKRPPIKAKKPDPASPELPLSFPGGRVGTRHYNPEKVALYGTK